VKCFYHNADLDGKCSAAIVRKKWPEIELIGINYGDEFPWETITPREPVIMVDFSLQPFSEMVRLRELTDALVWIDHHKTALNDAKSAGWLVDGLPLPEAPCDLVVPGARRDGIGACALTWSYLFPSDPVPEGVRLLAEYDVWNHEDPNCLPFQYGMRNLDNDLDAQAWRDIFRGEWRHIANSGDVILEYEKRQNAIKANAMCFQTELDGLFCIAANQGLSNSKFFDSEPVPEGGYDAMILFCWRKGKWTVSLYTDKPGVDVGAVAKGRGGGGHVGAAGFQCSELPFAPFFGGGK
jgi:hypothetical protein